MDELLQKAAEAMGMPPSLAERSARARAEKEGTTVEAVLAEWAGEAPAAAETTASEPTPEPAAEAPAPTAADPAPAAAAAPTEVTTEYLVALAADAKRMPAKLVRSSGEARARNAGVELDDVLATWAGVDLADLRAKAEAGEPLPAVDVATEPASSPDPTPTPVAEAAPDPTAEPVAAAPAVAAAAVAMSTDELLEKAAEARGMPASLVKRSADARAKKEGMTLDAVLAEWAGIDPATLAAAPAAVAAAPAAAAEPAAEAPAVTSSDDDIEVIEPDEPVADVPDEIEADLEPVAARSGGYPTWLAAAFVIIPLLAVTYILVSPNGPDCGTAGQLDIDPVTGLAVNCDGSEYGASTADFFAQGAAIYSQCTACHGANGEGAGNFPAFSGGAILATFPVGQCLDHVEWVALGTANFPEPTYGATNKPVGGSGALMPGYEGTLTPEEIAAVSLYERVAFGGQPLEEAELDCGLVVADGEAPADGGSDDMTEASGG